MRRATGLGLGVLLTLLLYGGYDAGRTQPEPETDLPYDLEDRLQRVEQKLHALDSLLTPESPPAVPKPAPPPKRPPRLRRPAPRRPPMPPPMEPRDAPLEVPPTAWVEARPRACPRGWTWAAVDRWLQFRTLGEGD